MRNTLSAESQAPSQDHSFLGWGPEGASQGSSQGVDPVLHQQRSAYLTPPRETISLDPAQLRQIASTSHLRPRPSKTQNRAPTGLAPPMRSSSRPEQCRLFSSHSASSSHSRGTEVTTSTIRRRHARDIFAEFGISRPSGWLSDDEEEDFSRHQDGANSIPRHATNSCHSCGAEVISRAFCNTCGHAVCPQCASEIPFDEESLDVEYAGSTQQRKLPSEWHALNAAEEETGTSSSLETTTETSKKKQTTVATLTTLKDNPFIRADRMTKVTAAEPQITDATIRAPPAARLSDCVPKQTDLGIADTHGNYGNPRCNATHAGHHSGRHSIPCIVEGHGKMNEVDRPSSHLSLADPLHNEIDKMYHHAEDLRRAQHIIEHLAAGSTITEGNAQTSTDDGLRIKRLSTPPMDSILSPTDSYGFNREKLASSDMAMAEDKKRTRA
ncbi:Putative Zinc finger, FYVE/PHD-type [Colletotrichum destructivum]|uniref:Zinc finger, FYVE/PHD-type n=1 Tax=Colletotrichum destructivum TaxID=34406 RepID=A0AAX4HZ36_9PEZI|nr:Putative Zinc finger, FYVE/PHD-type [Colletotrichum destructivum]